jgi:uncharacterized coiled-coil protein SlyX
LSAQARIAELEAALQAQQGETERVAKALAEKKNELAKHAQLAKFILGNANSNASVAQTPL